MSRRGDRWRMRSEGRQWQAGSSACGCAAHHAAMDLLVFSILYPATVLSCSPSPSSLHPFPPTIPLLPFPTRLTHPYFIFCRELCIVSCFDAHLVGSGCKRGEACPAILSTCIQNSIPDYNLKLHVIRTGYDRIFVDCLQGCRTLQI